MRLPILDAELALGIALGALDLKVVVPVRLEDLLHDVEHAQILENLALARERQEPEPRHDLGTVRGELVFGTAELHEAGDQAVDVARRGAGEMERSEEHTSELQSPCNLACRLL